MRINPEALLSADDIQKRIAEMAKGIGKELSDKRPVVLAVLKGAAMFASDLVRALPFDLTLDFIRARSYVGCESQGIVELAVLPETPLRARHVLLAEDILDTGRTSAVLLDWVRDQQPASIRLCVLLDKPSRRIADVRADYVGFTIADQFAVGYGLDYNESFRNLPAIHVLEPE